jgi:ribonuclease HII
MEKVILGIDECALGCWYGKLWAGAVILNKEDMIAGLNDSKKLKEATRDLLAIEIKARAKAFGVAFASVEEVEELGPLKASHLAMSRAIDKLGVGFDKILIDGNKVPKWQWDTEAIIKGDGKIPEIMAASILAKAARTEEMAEEHKKYPEYGFIQHHGYGTEKHQEALKKYGVLPGHRKTYAPIAKLIADKQKSKLVC